MIIGCVGCDKNMPGVLMAMGRLNRPSLMVYGGTIKPGMGCLNKQPLDVISAFQSYGEYTLHKMLEMIFYQETSGLSSNLW